MKPELAKQYLADIHAEIKAVAIRWSLHSFAGGGKKITNNPEWDASFCSVLSYRMAIIWGVTSGTAIRRLESLQEYGVRLDLPHRKFGIRKYCLSREDSLKYVHEAIEHWKKVGYSQTEIRPEIKEGAAA